MPTIQVQAQVSRDELFRAAGELNAVELERFVHDLLTLRARRKGTALSREETDLLSVINRGLPTELHGRQKALSKRRRAETLTAAEHEELIELTEKLEAVEAERVEALAELARLRGLTMDELMEQLGIRAPAHE